MSTQNTAKSHEAELNSAAIAAFSLNRRPSGFPLYSGAIKKKKAAAFELMH